jgi:glycolate oxidase
MGDTLATTDLLDTLASTLGAPVVVTGHAAMTAHLHDEAEWAPYGSPVALVRPTTTVEVQQAVKACAAHGVPLVARGAGTGLSGGANAVDGCVILSLERMCRILQIDKLERYAVVEPGVINDELRREAAKYSLWYPPDPASSAWSTIGGNIATNAGGICCVKYGVTRDYVLELQVVNAQGEIVRLGRRTAKGVAGYDLVSLMVGSEGTLGIVTEATLRLRPLQGDQCTIAGFFPSLTSAGRAIEEVAASGVLPSALELVDKTCLAAVDSWKNMGLSVEADTVLLARTDVPGAAGEQDADRILASFERAGATWAAKSTNRDEAEALFDARRLAYPALERLGPVLTEDICVPTRNVAQMLARIQQIGANRDVTIANIAHAGDGNLHPLIITPVGDNEAKTRAQQAFDEILGAALDLGGTVTGEHGVGVLKLPGLIRELDSANRRMQSAIKNALDPQGILNPGKAVADGPTIGSHRH